MIINIIGHGLQWGEEVAGQIQWQERNLPVEPHFNSVSFYCPAGEGFNGPDARLIVNEKWRSFVQEINDIHRIPEHFVFPNLEAWNDIVPRNPNDHNPPNPNEIQYVLPNIAHPDNHNGFLRLRQIVSPNDPFPEPQLVISPIRGTCISLSWLISNIPHIIEEHPALAALPNHDNYTYRWLVCRDLIMELNRHDNATSLTNINVEIQPLGERVDRLLW